MAPQDLERTERVLRHMIESHGLSLHAMILGHYVPEFKLYNTEFIGIGCDERRGISFGAVVNRTQLLFEIERSKVGTLMSWVNQAYPHLGTERCAQFAAMPEFVVMANVSHCREGLKSYIKTETKVTA